MATIKNVAGQGFYCLAWDTAADEAKKGDKANITATLSKDGAAVAPLGDEEPVEIGNGVYWLNLTQAETDADALALIPVSTTANVVLDPVIINTVTLTDYRADLSTLVDFDPAADIAESNGVDSWTYQQLLRLIFAVLCGERMGGGAEGDKSFKVPGGNKSRVVVPTDLNGNTTADVTLDASEV